LIVFYWYFKVKNDFNLENDSKLFTPGPLTTSLTVKQAMLHDLGSRDTVFMNIVAYIRGKLVELAGKILFFSKNKKFSVDFQTHLLMNMQLSSFREVVHMQLKQHFLRLHPGKVLR
jgi:aspartate aminotransferase-like enzyme